MIGESPTLPGTFHDNPLVVVTDDRSPAALTAFILNVPLVNLTWSGSSNGMPAVGGGGGPALSLLVSSQASAVLRQAFQRSQSRLLFSVRRFCSLNPISSANFFAPAPTSMM